MIKKYLFVIGVFFSLMFPIFSEGNKITINIGNESYVKDIPDNYEEACDMIKLLADLYNDANDEINKLNSSVNNHTSIAVSKLKDVEKELIDVKINLNNVKNTNAKLEKQCKELMSINNRFIFGVGFGPTFNINESSIGTHIEFIGNFRLIKNFHIGSSIFLDTYSNTNKINAGATIVASFGIY